MKAAHQRSSTLMEEQTHHRYSAESIWKSRRQMYYSAETLKPNSLAGGKATSKISSLSASESNPGSNTGKIFLPGSLLQLKHWIVVE